ncbi:MAG: type I-C CRISPR-associated protein Cas7/Csd2 [Bdellovibrionota bacterium]
MENNVIKNRYDFIMLFDVENGNPNGDPDAGNAPRTDIETGYGYVTDVCLKRKIRNYVETVKGGVKGYDIFIKMDKALNTKIDEASANEAKKKDAQDKAQDKKEFMCKKYFDIRAFGAVMSTGKNPCGVIRGPIQINFARSCSPVNPTEITITRLAITDVTDFNGKEAKSKLNEMGKKNFIPYGLYRAEGYISASLGEQTGLTEDDLKLFFEAILNMFEDDHSAARGKMSMRRLIVFKHESKLGNCQSYKLFDKVKVALKNYGVPPRSYDDYNIEVSNDRETHKGVTIFDNVDLENLEDIFKSNESSN